MSTLLDILAALPPEAFAEGASVEVQDGSGKVYMITFGKGIPPQDDPAADWLI